MANEIARLVGKSFLTIDQNKTGSIVFPPFHIFLIPVALPEPS